MERIDELLYFLEAHVSDFKLRRLESKLAVKNTSNSEVETLIAEFQKRFPKEKIVSLSLEEYALGTNRKEDSYSYWLEYKTDGLGSIKGGSVVKHGIWFSKEDGYRASNKFSSGSEEESMDIMRSVLAYLTKNGHMQDFESIEKISLADTIKYKTLYMYYPDLYFPMFSDMHYTYLIKELGYNPKHYKGIGAKQKILLDIKGKGRKLHELTNYEFIHFLYYLFGIPRRKKDNSSEIWIDSGILKDNGGEGKLGLVKGNLDMAYQLLDLDLALLARRKRSATNQNNSKPFKRDYEVRHKSNMIIGARGEALAIGFEKKRLEKYKELQDKVKQKSLTDDSLGYDILSFEADGRERYIEVKTTGRKISLELSFYLTDNELKTAQRNENYWIYVVSEIDSEMPKITPLKTPFSVEYEKYVQIKPLKYLVNIGVNEIE